MDNCRPLSVISLEFTCQYLGYSQRRSDRGYRNVYPQKTQQVQFR